MAGLGYPLTSTAPYRVAEKVFISSYQRNRWLSLAKINENLQLEGTAAKFIIKAATASEKS